MTIPDPAHSTLDEVLSSSKFVRVSTLCAHALFVRRDEVRAVESRRHHCTAYRSRVLDHAEVRAPYQSRSRYQRFIVADVYTDPQEAAEKARAYCETFAAVADLDSAVFPSERGALVFIYRPDSDAGKLLGAAKHGAV